MEKLIKEEDLHDRRETAGGTAVFGDSMFFDTFEPRVIDPGFGIRLLMQRVKEEQEKQKIKK